MSEQCQARDTRSRGRFRKAGIAQVKTVHVQTTHQHGVNDRPPDRRRRRALVQRKYAFILYCLEEGLPCAVIMPDLYACLDSIEPAGRECLLLDNSLYLLYHSSAACNRPTGRNAYHLQGHIPMPNSDLVCNMSVAIVATRSESLHKLAFVKPEGDKVRSELTEKRKHRVPYHFLHQQVRRPVCCAPRAAHPCSTWSTLTCEGGTAAAVHHRAHVRINCYITPSARLRLDHRRRPRLVSKPTLLSSDDVYIHPA